jgi:hypothetical protein
VPSARFSGYYVSDCLAVAIVVFPAYDRMPHPDILVLLPLATLGQKHSIQVGGMTAVASRMTSGDAAEQLRHAEKRKHSFIHLRMLCGEYHI